MVRRGSTVRVRQRALQKRCKAALLFRENLHDLQPAIGMEPFMEPSGSERALKRRKWTHSQESARPNSRSPTAMSFAVVSSLYPHTRSTALEESIMTATYTFDVFSTLDGFGSTSPGT